jgi:hypothetical protein
MHVLVLYAGPPFACLSLCSTLPCCSVLYKCNSEEWCGELGEEWNGMGGGELQKQGKSEK